MEKKLLIAALCSATLFVGCEYDDDDDYAVRRVSTTGAYYGDFDEYTPYYSYSGRRYYRTGNRYVYYTDRRPSYVAAVPSGAVYINPPRTRTVSTYYGDFDEYTPYYSYGERRYYRTGNRYVYYADRHPYYVSSLPSRAVYINPPRTHVTRVVRHVDDDYDEDD